LIGLKHHNMEWRRLNGNALDGDLHEAVRRTIVRERSAGHNLKVCIGTDSQVYGHHTEFATVIVFLREGRGGFMFISNERSLIRMSIKERLLNEVSRSIEVAYSICDLLDAHKVDLEVHADINTNPNFQSNPALSEAMGYILSMGFAFKAKPDAFASSSCADKMV